MIALVKYILFDFRGVGLCRHKLQKFTVIVEQSAIGYSNKSSSLVLVAGRWVSWSCWHCHRHKRQSHFCDAIKVERNLLTRICGGKGSNRLVAKIFTAYFWDSPDHQWACQDRNGKVRQVSIRNSCNKVSSICCVDKLEWT